MQSGAGPSEIAQVPHTELHKQCAYMSFTQYLLSKLLTCVSTAASVTQYNLSLLLKQMSKELVDRSMCLNFQKHILVTFANGCNFRRQESF